MRDNLQHRADNIGEVLRVDLRDFGIGTLNNLLIESLHVFCSKRGFERSELIKHTAEGPNVTFSIIGLIFPNFGTKS